MMGTWGIGHFENDSASDLLAELIDCTPNERLTALHRALTQDISEDYVEADFGQSAIAAANLVVLLANPQQLLELDDSIEEIADGLEPLDIHSQVPFALTALDVVKDCNRSEVCELWKETEDYEKWLEAIGILQISLASVIQKK
jgi:Domain of unknown function (DUF4259)